MLSASVTSRDTTPVQIQLNDSVNKPSLEESKPKNEKPKMKFQVVVRCIVVPLSKILNHLKLYIVVIEILNNLT